MCLPALLAALMAGSGTALGERWVLNVEPVADGVYVHQGVHEDVLEDNRGDIANVGFVVGDDCVAVIDTGGSPEVGAALRRAIAAVTEEPVCYVINTHVHPDHILGNSAFLGDAPEFVGHARLKAQLEARGPYYLRSISRMLGTELDDDVLVMPDVAVSDHLRLNLGGRQLLLEAMPRAHTDNDLVILDEATDTLWLGDLLFVDRVPSLDGSLRGWLSVLADLGERDVARVVPGHGPASVDWPQAAEPLRRYLQTLLEETRAAIHQGATIEQAAGVVGQSERGAWKLFEDYHQRNVQNAYAELEWE